MASMIQGILYKENQKRFEQIRAIAADFSTYYIGQNIIQDDIFTVIENYARTKDMPLEWLRFPIEDSELCACTFIRGGRIFVILNSGMPMSKQIFAAAHELYHIRCFLEDHDPELAKSGSILDSKTVDAETTKMEEQILSASLAEKMIEVPFSEIRRRIQITGKAKRWDMVPAGYEKFGSLLENLMLNSENESLPKS